MTGISPHTPPLSAAAFSELYGRFEVAFCDTREREAEILAGFNAITKWANEHSPEVRRAYAWAITILTQQIKGQIQRAEHARRVIEAGKTLPLPPIDLPDASS